MAQPRKFLAPLAFKEKQDRFMYYRYIPTEFSSICFCFPPFCLYMFFLGFFLFVSFFFFFFFFFFFPGGGGVNLVHHFFGVEVHVFLGWTSGPLSRCFLCFWGRRCNFGPLTRGSIDSNDSSGFHNVDPIPVNQPVY